MIIFADQTLLPTIMLHKASKMSFMTMLAIGKTVKNLVPPMNIAEHYYMSEDDFPNSQDEKETHIGIFRSMYLQFLCEQYPFVGIMEIMMEDFYNSDGVIVITDLSSNMVYNMIECICQFIYDRWRYPTAIVSEAEDFNMPINQSEIDPRCIGIFNADKEFYLKHAGENIYD